MTQNSLVAFPVEPSKFPRLFPERGAPMLFTYLTGRSASSIQVQCDWALVGLLRWAPRRTAPATDREAGTLRP